MPMPDDTASPRHFAVVPAAGTGSRVGAMQPKQYLPLGERTVIEHAVAPLLAASWIAQIVVVVAPGDERAAALPGLRHPRIDVVAAGGPSRRESVLGGLGWLAQRCGARGIDWVHVHDAARPGLDADTLERLRDTLERLRDTPERLRRTPGDARGATVVGMGEGPLDGALLALPVVDTVKQADGGLDAGHVVRVARTVSRDALWLAQTPQSFRFEALSAALARHADVTDEASAIEAEGGRPVLVAGSRRNFKVTTAEDLEMMRALLAGR
jgi:2-C-methyl-D-erythritol 4-phosphate cytidylyltransferase